VSVIPKGLLEVCEVPVLMCESYGRHALNLAEPGVSHSKLNGEERHYIFGLVVGTEQWQGQNEQPSKISNNIPCSTRPCTEACTSVHSMLQDRPAMTCSQRSPRSSHNGQARILHTRRSLLLFFVRDEVCMTRAGQLLGVFLPEQSLAQVCGYD
jgi:hypothetical protein